MYRSYFTDDALENIKKLPKAIRKSLKQEFQKKIHVNPIDCSEPLSKPLQNFRSFHFGDYRVMYQVFNDLKAVSVVGVGKKDRHHRSEIYRQLEVLAERGKLAAAVLDTLRTISGKEKS
ncbi:MAG: type II toxin-antitoxin system RelE/ParE family toxin [Candidatus Acidiferrales bacterium]